MTPTIQWRSETYCALHVELNSVNMVVLSGMPGHWRFDQRIVVFRPTGANVSHIMAHWPEVVWAGGTHYFRDQWEMAQAALAHVRATKQDVTLLSQADDFVYRTRPHDHQRKAFLLSRDCEWFGLFMDPGTGKTKVALDTAAYLYQHGKIDTLLVLAPNGVHWNWTEEEIPVHFALNKFALYTDTSARSKTQTRHFETTLAHQGMSVFAFHIEGLTSKTACALIERVLKTRRCLWVIDESSRIKTPSAQRTKWVVDRRKLAPYRRILTGTPVTKGLEDLYSQLLFLSPLILGFDTYTTFKAHYCREQKFDMGQGRSFIKILGYQNVPELVAQVDGCAYRVRKDECLDLPPKIYQRFSFELGPKARKLYDQMATEYMAEMDGQVISENLAITRLLRLQQIACGWWPSEDENVLTPIDTGKSDRLKALLQVLEDLGDRKVIIWARFQADFVLLQRELGDAAVSYHGKVSDAGRQASLQRFRHDPTCFYLVANPQNAGVGLTLNESDVHVWYCNRFDLELRIQGEDRSHRIGQTAQSVLYIDLEARRTLDSKVIQALRAKKNIADLVTMDPKSFFLTYTEEVA